MHGPVIRTFALVAVLTLALTACGSGDVGDGNLGIDVGVGGIDGLDVIGGVGTDTSVVGGPSTDAVPADAGLSETPGSGLAQDGEPCEENADCPGGWCVDGPEGGLCTSTCDDECDPGWSCQMVGAAGSDAIFICVPLFAEICRPCHDDKDCSDEPGSLQPKCLDYGAAGSFCGSACDDDSSCPVGYSCDEGQCRLQSGECECTVRYIFQEASTTCELSNAQGTCAGERVCADDGLTACDAAEPSVDICDGIDNDCDDETDEGFVAEPTTCGSGSCLAIGGTDCVDGEVIDTCVVPAGTALDTVCNGVDDDCDGETDEEFEPGPTTCGFGLCESSGTTACTNGLLGSDCVPLEPDDDTDPSCDGVDQDCDGVTDEDFMARATSCGVGACSNVGTLECVAGEPLDNCVAGLGAEGFSVADDATCDGVDDDCDGVADDDYIATPTTCGSGACAATGEMACQAGVVVDTCAAGDSSPHDVTCDGVDDDCDGTADEDYVPAATACGAGACAAVGVTSCVGGEVMDSCEAGAAAVADASCDGVDDDCDGATDEDYVELATACGSGACGAVGATSCVAGVELDSCVAGTAADFDATCDGVDDDCDGVTDEDFLTVPTSCGAGACAATGETSCVAGDELDSCSASDPAADDVTCDGVDDDCNGATDDGYSTVATACGDGACAASGETSCVAGAVVDSCVAGEGALSDASCDGVDNDCDGHTDEDHAPVPTSCGTGPCAGSGTISCLDGLLVDSCESGTGDVVDATCDGVDDDCDGVTDDDYVSMGTFCGTGACEATGSTSCVDGSIVNSCSEGVAAATDAGCDGVDDDCDGVTDQDFVGAPTTCGVGACAASGTTSCAGGVVVDSCVEAPALGALDMNCDGVDDDCSGEADEDFSVTPTACGTGACASTGQLTCSGGGLVDTCSAGTGSATDATCNGVDDDCSGLTDEDYVVTPTSCGIGACASTGQLTCSGGDVVNTCSAGSAAGNDATCDGVDDDCSGQTDEDYASTSTTCGTGACASTGTLTCVGGHPADSCVEGPAAATDASCDGVDDDCDGQTDQDCVVVAPEPNCDTTLSAGHDHVCAIDSESVVHCWGRNSAYQVGQATLDFTYRTPQPVVGDAALVTSGYDHTCIIDKASNAWCWGEGDDGRLGNGATDDSATPVQVSGPTGWDQIDCGQDHCCGILQAGGAVACWGANDQGQLGVGTTNPSHVPKLTGLTGARHISAGARHTCVVTNPGTLFCWGINDNGQIGQPTGTTTKSTGAVGVPEVTNAVQVGCGERSTCILLSTGVTKCFGHNTSWQLGGPNPMPNTHVPTQVFGPNNAKRLGIGFDHHCSVANGTAAICWGNGSEGEMGTGGKSSQNGPGNANSMNLVTSITGGDDFTCASSSDGSLKCWGDNDEGSLGTGVTTDSVLPALVSGFTMAPTSSTCGN